MEKEHNQTIKSILFCQIKWHKCEKVEEWIKRVRVAENECDYQEQERQILEQSISGLNDEHMQNKILSEIKARGKTDKITNEQVMMWETQEESNRTQI